MLLPQRRRWIGLLVTLLGMLALASCFLVGDPRSDLPYPQPPASVAIYDRNGSILYEALDPERGKASFVALDHLPLWLRQATVATEDASFYSNPGIDPVAILRAALQNWRNEGIVSGGSTITQQLVRNLWMTPEERREQSLVRKLREALLALRVSVRLSKNEILELYLNTISYGHQTVGVDAAASVYFGKNARDLDLAECALLAGLPQAPSSYDPFIDLPKAKDRQRLVLSLMAKQGYITDQEAVAAADEPLQLASAAFPVRAPHFVAYVRQLLADRLGDDLAQAGRLQVRTTLDLGIQEVAEATVRRHVASLADRDVSNGALVALDPASGEILAMVGSVDYFDHEMQGEVNIALSLRQPGSALKPFLYGAALERGFTTATVLHDIPTTFLTADGKNYAPENYDRSWHGPVLVREALANSYNLPAVKAMQYVGVAAFLDVAFKAGLSSLASKSSAGLSLALGSGEVRLLDLTSAYASLAAGGSHRSPTALLRVESGDGRNLLPEETHQARRLFSPQVAYLLTHILSDDEARSVAFGRYSPLRLSRPAAAKTGTTTDWRDNWTVGYTPDLVTGVWVGNADNRPMRGVSGISGAAPIWHDFMEEVLKGHPPQQFVEPPELIRRDVCPESGELPTRWCPNRRTELFIQGTEPKGGCSWHQPFLIDRSTGLLAGPNCPQELVELQLFQVVPPDLRGWARERGIAEPPVEECSAHGLPSQGLSKEPRLTITSPTHGAVLRISPEIPPELQKLELTAVATGLGGGARVELWVDGIQLGSFQGTPHRATWQIASGNHRFRAVARDSAGSILASDEVTILVE